jgi:mannobiose 2-epimerase
VSVTATTCSVSKKQTPLGVAVVTPFKGGYMLNKQTAEKLVRGNILPFWQGMIDKENGGFYGEADFYGKINKTADKGCILNSRILWTFSAAYRLFNDEEYKDCAFHARDFLEKAFFDNEFGGLYWQVNNTGRQPNTRKQFYNIAFGIYALSEFYLTFKDESSLKLAFSLFDVMEKYGFDPVKSGYIEARVRDWSDIDDYRLSGKDLNSPKSMNTNLHVLEAYTTLTIAASEYASQTAATGITPAAAFKVRSSLESLLQTTLEKIVNQKYNFELFFDMDWNSLSKEISYGHDIEGSWLMYEAALAAGTDNLISKVKQTSLAIANVIHAAAVDKKNGGLLSGCDENGKLLTKKEWWPQAEAVVGFFYAYKLSREQKYFDAAESIWNYINNHFVDSVKGEWHNELHPDNTPDTNMPKAGFWKCPYHNARACFEIIKHS